MIPKFRAWYKKEKKMLEVAKIDFRTEVIVCYSFDIDRRKNQYIYLGLKNDCILMQSTALKDKNGKEIFDGDILQGENKKEYFEVIFYRQCWSLRYTCLCGKKAHGSVVSIRKYYFRLKVIGNIHENPKLLGVSK